MDNKQKSNAELIAEIEKLQKELGIEKVKRTEAEEAAHSMAQASPFLGSTAEEQPTGRTIKVKVCLNPWVRDEKEQKFKTVEYPTYYYRIDLPKGAGLNLSTNGIEYAHGETYEFDAITLAEMKSRVARCWDHEKSIHGDNANAYRKHTPMYYQNTNLAKIAGI